METGDVAGLPDDIVGLQPVSAAKAFAGEGGSFGGVTARPWDDSWQMETFTRYGTV